jgi:hypothetical protein
LGPSRPNEGIDGRAPRASDAALPEEGQADRGAGSLAPHGRLASGRGLIAQIIGRLQDDDLAFDSRTHFVPS